jgi:hypothetical protein
MKNLLLVAAFCTLSLSVSAQWISFRKHPVLPLLPQARRAVWQPVLPAKVSPVKQPLHRGIYDLELETNSVMKAAQHHMRFRMYDVASYDFRDLAQLYVQQSRLSEAKWFFLQSNIISRQQNNDKLTIANLISLAGVKSNIGDFMLAQQDLVEARGMAMLHGWLVELMEIQKQMDLIQHNRIATAAELRYASSAPSHNTVD